MNESNWTKEPAIPGKHGGCLCCGPRQPIGPEDYLPLEDFITRG